MRTGEAIAARKRTLFCAYFPIQSHLIIFADTPLRLTVSTHLEASEESSRGLRSPPPIKRVLRRSLPLGLPLRRPVPRRFRLWIGAVSRSVSVWKADIALSAVEITFQTFVLPLLTGVFSTSHRALYVDQIKRCRTQRAPSLNPTVNSQSSDGSRLPGALNSWREKNRSGPSTAPTTSKGRISFAFLSNSSKFPAGSSSALFFVLTQGNEREKFLPRFAAGLMLPPQLVAKLPLYVCLCLWVRSLLVRLEFFFSVFFLGFVFRFSPVMRFCHLWDRFFCSTLLSLVEIWVPPAPPSDHSHYPSYACLCEYNAPQARAHKNWDSASNR